VLARLREDISDRELETWHDIAAIYSGFQKE